MAFDYHIRQAIVNGDPDVAEAAATTANYGFVKQAAAVADLDQDISASYTEAEVQAISDKVDALLAALRTAGVLAS